MISLAKFVSEHREAVESDLLKCGFTLDDVGRRLSWSALNSFIKNISSDSELMRSLRPDLWQWSTQAKTNAILADVFDLLNVINSNMCAKGSGKRPKKPKPYPRPINSKEKKRIGTAMPIAKLHKKIFGRKG